MELELETERTGRNVLPSCRAYSRLAGEAVYCVARSAIR